MTTLPAHFNDPTLYSKSSLIQHEKNQKALLAVSGGQDSSLVGWILFQTQYSDSLEPVSVHYQHFWQKDTLYAKKHCSQLNFWFNWEIVYFQSTFNYATEKNAGDWRENTTGRLTHYYRCTQVIKGHSLTDRYETMFSQLLHAPVNKIKTPKGKQSTKKTKATPHSIGQRQKTTLFVQQKNKSCWILPRREDKAGSKTKLYDALKYGT